MAFLRSLGLPLDDVRTSLHSDPSQLRALMADHMASLDAQLTAQQRLRSRLAHLVDQPYGYREYSAMDPEGHLWSFMKALG